MSTKKKIKNILIEFFLFSFLIFILCINIGNYKFNLFINNVIGSKFGIIQNLDKINTDYNSGYNVFNVFPSQQALNKIRNLESISYVGSAIPTYLEIEQNDTNNVQKNVDTLKIIGVDHRYTYDFLIEKIKLIDGRVFSENELEESFDNAIISKKYAKIHNLKVGDSHTVDNVIHDNSSKVHRHAEIATTLKVIGIFEPNIFSEIATESDESQFNEEMMNTTIYVSNKKAKKIKRNKIAVEVNTFPQNYENIKDLYIENIKNKEEIINYLNKEEYYEISIIPKEGYNIIQIKNDISRIISNYPYVSIINTSNRYKKFFILGNFAIPFLILDIICLIIFNIKFCFELYKEKSIKLNIIKTFFLRIFILYLGTNIGILLAGPFRYFYLNLKTNYSNDMPKDYELYSYNLLDKVILTNGNISDVMGCTAKEMLFAFGLTFVFILVISLIVFNLIKYKCNSYRRLSDG